jgi:tight adherence protein B
MRRVVALCAVLLCALAVAGAPAQGATPPRLTEAAGARFPDRAFALTLPKPGPVPAGDVSLTENGRAVPHVDVVPAERTGGRRFGVVLAIDTSYSMHGRPLEAAQEAARAFIRRRRPDQPVALISFAGDVRVLLPFTTDPAAIERSLASVTASGGGSRIIDAASQAVAMIRAAGMSSGSAIVLSDGADRGSHRTIDAVSTAAGTSGARVFSVGLRSHSDDFGTLNLLAAGSSGEFSSAASLNDLARVYDRLGSQLAHQYLLRYRSGAAPGQRVNVQVRIAGVAGSADATYTAPAVPVHISPPFHHAPLESFWTTPSAMLFIALLVAALMGLAVWAILRPRRGSLRERMAAFVAPPPEEGAEPRTGQLSDRLLHGAERSLERRAWWTAFQERVDVARIKMPPVRLLALVATGTLLLFILLPVIGGSPAFALPALLLPVVANAIIDRKAAQQRKLFGEQLPDNLQVIASAMRAGHSFAGALSVVVEDAPEPTRREMQRVIADERLGVPLDTALGVVVRRMESEDLEQVALVAALHRETGGNTAEVLDRVTESVRERMGLQRMVRTLTAQGRMSRWVLTALPCVLLAVISALNPAYVAPLFETTIGRVLLGLAAAMVCAGSMVIKRIVDIKV